MGCGGSNQVRCLTVFITHYHGVSEMALAHPGVVDNFHMAYIEGARAKPSDPPAITFLYRLVAGACQRSFGLHVARLADLPAEVVAVAAAQSEGLQKLMEAKQAGASAAFLGTVQAAWQAGRAAALRALQTGAEPA